LQRLPAPFPRHTKAQLRHTQSELGAFLAHRHLRLHRCDFAVLADIVNLRRRLLQFRNAPVNRGFGEHLSRRRICWKCGRFSALVLPIRAGVAFPPVEHGEHMAAAPRLEAHEKRLNPHTIMVDPLTPVVGAEIGGIDLSKPMSAEQLRER
jgi:hypothetical protein